MPNKQLQKKILISLLFLLTLYYSSHAQDLAGIDKETFDRGIFHFEKKEYQNGLSYFRELINKYPRDPVFNYYSGVSMVELMIDLETAVRQLQLASLKKEVPRNVYFYLGKACHIQGDFDEAIQYYKSFRDYGERNEIRELETEKLIASCEEQTIPTEWELEAKRRSGTGEGESATLYDHLVGEALKLQSEADSVRRLTDHKRSTLQNLTGEEKRSVEQEILNLEKLASSLQDEADAKYEMIRQMEEEQPEYKSLPYTSEELEPGMISAQLMEELELAPGAMLGKQLNDETYFQTHLSILFTGEDAYLLDELDKTNRSAIETMRDATRLQGELAQQRLKANAAQNKRESNRALTNIAGLENRILAIKYEAITKYQEVNDGMFRIFEDKIVALRNIAPEDERKTISEEYHRQAMRSYDRALKLRDEAKNSSGIENKYDKLSEANAYELIALENQKRGYATLAGIMPLPEAKVTATAGEEPGMKEETSTREAQNEVSLRDSVAEGEKETEEKKIAITEKLIKEKLSGEPEKPASKERISEADPNPRYQPVPWEYGLSRQSTSPYSEWDPIPLDMILPGGVLYRIQIGVFRNPVSPDFFGTLFPVSAETDLEKAFIRYYAGLFRHLSDAEKALPEVKRVGFDDAFIVAHFQERRITLHRAKELEVFYDPGKETWEEIEGETGTSGSREIPVYRLLLGFFPDRLTKERLNFYQEKAGKLKIQYLNNMQGEFIYTIGNFSTFEEAEIQKRILVSKGLEGLVTKTFIGNRVIRNENR